MLWSDNYLVGNELVDNDHKEIFSMVDRLLEDDFSGRPEKIKTVVGFLMDYVAKHFGNEEKLMVESSYPSTAAHIKQHAEFVKVAQSFAAKLEGNLESVDLSMEVNEVIVDWLAEHVMISDKGMINHYRKWAAAKK